MAEVTYLAIFQSRCRFTVTIEMESCQVVSPIPYIFFFLLVFSVADADVPCAGCYQAVHCPLDIDAAISRRFSFPFSFSFAQCFRGSNVGIPGSDFRIRGFPARLFAVYGTRKEKRAE